MAKKSSRKKTAPAKAPPKNPERNAERRDVRKRQPCRSEGNPDIIPSENELEIEDGVPLSLTLRENGIRDDELTDVVGSGPDVVVTMPENDLYQGGLLPSRMRVWTTDGVEVSWSRSASAAARRKGYASGKLTITIIRSGRRGENAEDLTECFEYRAMFIPGS